MTTDPWLDLVESQKYPMNDSAFYFDGLMCGDGTERKGENAYISDIIDKGAQRHSEGDDCSCRCLLSTKA